MKRIATITLTLIILFSCQENIVDLDIGASESQLVIGGFINTDSTVIIKISRTVHPLETDAEYGVKDARVTLFENDQPVTHLRYDNNDSDSEVDDVYVSDNQFVPEAGNEYSVLIESEGYTPVRASTSIPEEIEIDHVEIGRTLVQVGDFLNGVNASISFQDPPQEENYYSIVIREKRKVYHEYDEFGQPIEASGFVFENRAKPLLPRLDDKIEFNGKSNFEFNVLYLSDVAFEGRLYTYDFLMHAPDGGELTVYLNHITREHYQYGTTSQLQQQESTENPFSQPVQVFTNVDNGLGIFVGYHVTSVVLN